MSFLRLLALFYGAVALLGLAGIAAAGRLRETLLPVSPETVLVGLAAGAGFGALVLGLSILLHRASAWVRGMEGYFAELLGPLSAGAVLFAAAASALGEELLFRGALQPWLGLVPTSLLFGLLHFPMERKLAPWTAFATATGFALGYLYESTGTLAAPLAAHFVINAVNLWRITPRP